MKTFLSATLFVSAALSCAGTAIAQTVPLTAGATTAAAASGEVAQRQRLYRGSRIIGTNVRDAKERKIGQIRDLVLDSRRGEIAYAIVSFGGVMGVGRKYHAIPWLALQPSEDGRYYTLHADRETINTAPGFDKARWPDMSDRKWSSEIDRYWNRRVGARHCSQ